MRRTGPVLAILLATLTFACGATKTPSAVHTATLDLTAVTLPTVVSGDRLMADLQRSPLWHVRQEQGGMVASLRVVRSGSFRGESLFLRSWVATGTPLGDRVIANDGWRSDEVVDLDVELKTVVQSLIPPDTVAAAGGSVALPIYEGFSGQGLDGNAWSTLALPLGTGLWLTIREQGKRPDRTATRSALDVAVAELARVAALPESYLGKEVYGDVFAALGAAAPFAVRYPGLQDRDWLGVVLIAADGKDYGGVRVHVLDDPICGGECTLGWRQDRKAELLGSPPRGDWLFALASDTAVFLSDAENAKYGVFSGNRTFDAEIRWSDATGAELFTVRGPFRGWER